MRLDLNAVRLDEITKGMSIDRKEVSRTEPWDAPTLKAGDKRRNHSRKLRKKGGRGRERVS